MQVSFNPSTGFAQYTAFLPAIADRLLSADARKRLDKIAPQLDEAWQAVSDTCPRRREETIHFARQKVKASPGDSKALEALRVLAAEPDAFVNERHQAAHSRYNQLAVSLAADAITALRAVRAEVERRAGLVSKLWSEVIAVFPHSFDDAKVPDLFAGRIANTCRTLDEQIGRLRQARSNESVITLSDLGLLAIKTETRQAATGDYCDPADLARAHAA